MELRDLHLFLALAEALHFGQAAARMHLSQPAFSRRIAALEAELGAPLVERDSRNVRLTAAGTRFAADALDILARLRTACRDARLTAAGEKGEIRLGFMMHAAHRLAPALIRAHAARHPGVTLKLQEATPAELEEMIDTGRADAAITLAAPPSPAARARRQTPILRDPLVLATPAGGALSRLPIARPADLAGAPLIAAPQSQTRSLRALIDAWCAGGEAADRAVIPPRIVYEPHLQHTILRLAAAGLGSALVPGSICTAPMEGIAIVPLLDPPELEIVLLTRADAGNPALPGLIALAREHVLSPEPGTGPGTEGA